MLKILKSFFYIKKIPFQYEPGVASSVEGDACSEEDYDALAPSKMSVSSEPAMSRGGQGAVGSLYHGTWPVVSERTMWNSDPVGIGATGGARNGQGCINGQMVSYF